MAGKRITPSGFYTSLDQRDGYSFVKEYERQKIYLAPDGHFVCHTQGKHGDRFEHRRGKLTDLERSLTPKIPIEIECMQANGSDCYPSKVKVASYDKRFSRFRDADGHQVSSTLYRYDEAIFAELQAIHQEYRLLRQKHIEVIERATRVRPQDIAEAAKAAETIEIGVPA